MSLLRLAEIILIFFCTFPNITNAEIINVNVRSIRKHHARVWADAVHSCMSDEFSCTLYEENRGEIRPHSAPYPVH
jgi:hypothetical protein